MEKKVKPKIKLNSRIKRPKDLTKSTSEIRATRSARSRKKKAEPEKVVGIFDKYEIFAYFAFYTLLLVIFDIAFLLYFRPMNINYFIVFLIDIAIGLLISFLLSFGSKKYKTTLLIICNILVIFYCTFEVIEIVVDNTVGDIFTFSTIIFNLKIVFQEYGDEIFELIKAKFLVLFLLVCFGIVIVLISKRIYIDNKLEFNKKSRICMISVAIFMFVLSFFLTNSNVYDFKSDMNANGLKVAILHDMFKNYKLQIIQSPKEEDTSNVSEAKEKDIDKPYYYDTSKYNVINFDFDELMEKEEREDYNSINDFIKNRKPTEKNEYTGIFKGKNLIMICAEAWNSRVVDPELFPAMYRLINNGFKFDNFYQPHGASSTSSGEYSFLAGMIPVNNDRTFINSTNNNMGFSISMKMHNLGYHTYSFHNGRSTYYGRDETHDSLMGFNQYIANDTGLNDMTNQFYTDDYNLLKAAYDKVSKETPFLAYLMTYSGHKPYVGELNGRLETYYRRVDMKYGNAYTEPVKYYIAKNLFLEEGLEYILQKLEEDNLLNDTVICMVPDHYPYGLININEIVGDDVDYLLDFYKTEDVIVDKAYRDRTDAILWSGSLESEYKSLVKPIEKVACTIDLMPTLLNLFGMEFDSRLYPGKDIFSNSEGKAIYQNGMYVNNKNEIWYVPTVIKSDSEPNVFEVNNLLNYCRFNVTNDYYGYLMDEKGNKQKTCYLTFDGGPTSVTLQILKTLRNENIKATFFITAEKDMTIARVIINDGHTMGVQSFSKNYEEIYGNDLAFSVDFAKICDIAKGLSNGPIWFMRFYGGSGNTIGLKTNPGGMTRATQSLESLGIKYVDWNVDSGDSEDISKDEIVENVLKGADEYGDICVLLHDGRNNENTIEALPEIISKLKERGYRFKKINEFSHLFHQTIMN